MTSFLPSLSLPQINKMGTGSESGVSSNEMNQFLRRFKRSLHSWRDCSSDGNIWPTGVFSREGNGRRLAEIFAPLAVVTRNLPRANNTQHIFSPRKNNQNKHQMRNIFKSLHLYFSSFFFCFYFLRKTSPSSLGKSSVSS